MHETSPGALLPGPLFLAGESMDTFLTPITTLDLDVLLGALREHPQEILRLIDEDPQLKRRERADGLIIANSGPTLFEPQYAHQLYAKGIVYAREPEYRFVSMPLVKMFNHGLREHSDATSRALLERGGVGFVFPDKLDGTMVQLFAHEGEVVLTTRSVLEGVQTQEEGPYLSFAREVLSAQHPGLLAASEVEGLSLVFELIHPATRQVTNYGASQRMVLLTVLEHATLTYWSTARTNAWASARGVAHAEVLIEEPEFLSGVDRLHAKLGVDERIPEGSIVCFEEQGRVVHRVKVKTAEYLHHFALRHKVTYKTVVEQLWDAPGLQDWEAFLAHLIMEKMSEEEVEAFYKSYFDAFMLWQATLRATHARLTRIMQAWEAEHGAKPQEDGRAQRVWFKQLAAHMRAQHEQDFGLLMSWARKGGLTLQQLMWHDPAYPGFRALLSEAGIRG